MHVSADSYIGTREDYTLRDFVIEAGEHKYTQPFSLAKDGQTGALALYVDCDGPGKLTTEYEVDPGWETGDSNLVPVNWFPAEYGNPIMQELPSGRLAKPLSCLVARNIRFKLYSVGGPVRLITVRLVIQ